MTKGSWILFASVAILATIGVAFYLGDVHNAIAITWRAANHTVIFLACVKYLTKGE